MSHKNKQKKIVLLSLTLVCFATTSCAQTPTTLIPTKLQNNAITETPATSLTAVQTSQPEIAGEDTGYEGYYQGIVSITEYYTLLGNELPEEAYKVLSNAAQKPHSLEEFVEAKKVFFKKVEIVTIKPLVVWQKENRITSVTPDQEDKIRFYVQIKAWGEGAMSGSARSGELQTQYLTLIKEGEDWKIDSFATGLVIPTPSLSTVFPTLDPGSVPDSGYYDSIVVIAQFHALFNHRLYESAYQLLSLVSPHPQSLDEFISDIETFGIIERKIVDIHPFYEDRLQLQNFSTPDPFSRRMFYARIYAKGKSGWAGSVPNGIHTYFITTVLEEGAWKIYSVNTAPLP